MTCDSKINQYIIIALLHSSLFVSDWRRQVGGLLVKTYRHVISEILMKFVQQGSQVTNSESVISNIWRQLSYHLWWSSDVTGSCITGNDVTGRYITGNDITGNDVTGTGSRKPEMKGRSFPAFSPGTPLDSRYEQWNCESNQSQPF